MNFRRIIVGELATNCYIVGDKECVLIDPGDDAEKIISVIEKNELNITKILLTHGHFDHVMGAERLREYTGAKIYIHKDDKEALRDKKLSFAFFMRKDAPNFYADEYLNEGDIIEFGSDKLEVIHTPGHTKGSVTFFGDNKFFLGDLIFYESVGRCNSDIEMLQEIESFDKIARISKTASVYPGHGVYTDMQHEINYNPFLR